MRKLYNFSWNTFGKLAKYFDSYFKLLEKDLFKSHRGLHYLKYGSFVIFSGIISLVVSLLITLSTIFLLNLRLILLIPGFFICLIVSTSITMLTFYYPKMSLRDKKKRIENSLPFTTIYLATLAKSGYTPVHLFKVLSKFKEYKVLVKEAKHIISDVEAMSLDLPTALKRAMNRSPSEEWTELLSGINTTVAVGGDLSSYLEEKAAGFLQEYRRRIESFSKVLSTLVQVYVTVVIVGIIFFIIISSLMVSIGGINVGLVKVIQYLMVVVGLPLFTIGFIVMSRSLSPWSNG